MKKKVLYVGGGAAAVMLLLALLFGSDATSYVTTSELASKSQTSHLRFVKTWS